MITDIVATDISDDNDKNEGIIIIYLIYATIQLVLYIVINIIIISIITITAIINLNIIVNNNMAIMSTIIMMNNILLVITLSIAYFLLPPALSLL